MPGFLTTCKLWWKLFQVVEPSLVERQASIHTGLKLRLRENWYIVALTTKWHKLTWSRLSYNFNIDMIRESILQLDHRNATQCLGGFRDYESIPTRSVPFYRLFGMASFLHAFSTSSSFLPTSRSKTSKYRSEVAVMISSGTETFSFALRPFSVR